MDVKAIPAVKQTVVTAATVTAPAPAPAPAPAAPAPVSVEPAKVEEPTPAS